MPFPSRQSPLLQPPAAPRGGFHTSPMSLSRGELGRGSRGCCIPRECHRSGAPGAAGQGSGNIIPCARALGSPFPVPELWENHSLCQGRALGTPFPVPGLWEHHSLCQGSGKTMPCAKAGLWEHHSQCQDRTLEHHSLCQGSGAAFPIFSIPDVQHSR